MNLPVPLLSILAFNKRARGGRLVEQHYKLCSGDFENSRQVRLQDLFRRIGRCRISALGDNRPIQHSNFHPGFEIVENSSRSSRPHGHRFPGYNGGLTIEIGGQIGYPTSAAALRKNVFLTTLHRAPAPVDGFATPKTGHVHPGIFCHNQKRELFNLAERSSTIVAFSGLILVYPLCFNISKWCRSILRPRTHRCAHL